MIGTTTKVRDMTATTTDAPAVETVPMLEMVQPILGFPAARHFTIVDHHDSLLRTLQCLDDDALRFLVVPPNVFYPDYAPVVSDQVVEDLEITAASDVLLLVLLSAPDGLATATVNLRAPLVINVRTRRAAQVVLEDQDHPLAAPLQP
jgi:flagellar assembly factor FliW